MSRVDNRLLLAKHQYARGCDALKGGGMFDAGLAVSLFQDAVETVIFACGAHYGANPSDRKSGFVDIWEATNRVLASASKEPLPMKLQMDALNKARINFKHFGQTLTERDAHTFRVDAEQFLVKVLKDSFELEFARLSIASLVADDGERSLLEAALKDLEEQKSQDCLVKCSRALSSMDRRREQFYSPGLLLAYPNIEPATKKYVDDQITHLRLRIRELEAMTFAENCGVSAADMLVLRAILPQLRGEVPQPAEWPLGAVSEYTARRCIETLAHYSLGLSHLLKATERMLQEHAFLF